MIFWFTVSNTGQSQLVAFAMIEKEETSQFAKVSRLFVKQMGGLSPKTVIIERQLKLYQALKDTLSPKTEVLFCYYHIVRTLKT